MIKIVPLSSLSAYEADLVIGSDVEAPDLVGTLEVINSVEAVLRDDETGALVSYAPEEVFTAIEVEEEEED